MHFLDFFISKLQKNKHGTLGNVPLYTIKMNLTLSKLIVILFPNMKWEKLQV